MRTELPSGAWVEHRPIHELKRRDKRAMSSVLRLVLPLTADGELDTAAAAEGVTLTGGLMYEAATTAAACILTGWSYDLPLPRWDAERQVTENGASLDEIPLEDSDALDALLAPYTAKLLARPDPKDPRTATTSSSNGSSRAKAPSSPRG